MIPLQQIQIKSPCQKSWDAMDGDNQKRYCDGCRKDVFNLSAMTAAAAQDVIDAHAGNLCVRFHVRHDGGIVTSDPPQEPVRLRRTRAALSFGWAAALIVAGIIGLPGMALSTPQHKHLAPKHDKLTQLLGEATILPKAPSKQHGTVENPKPPTTPELPAMMGKPMAPPPKTPSQPLPSPGHANGSAKVPETREMIGDIAMPTPMTAFEPLRPAHPIRK